MMWKGPRMRDRSSVPASLPLRLPSERPRRPLLLWSLCDGGMGVRTWVGVKWRAWVPVPRSSEDGEEQPPANNGQAGAAQIQPPATTAAERGGGRIGPPPCECIRLHCSGCTWGSGAIVEPRARPWGRPNFSSSHGRPGLHSLIASAPSSPAHVTNVRSSLLPRSLITDALCIIDPTRQATLTFVARCCLHGEPPALRPAAPATVGVRSRRRSRAAA